MKLMHLSDLHLGKRVNEYSMLPDQEYILNQILTILDAEQPDAVLIAGDVYDKSVAPAEAVDLFDRFLVKLSKQKVHVFVSSGNHDSPERLAFGGRLMEASGIHLSPVYDGTCQKVTLVDEFGPVDIYMLPFVKPATVRRHFPELEITTYSEAVAAAINTMEVDKTRRNVLLSHQFVTGASTCESEELYVGGLEHVDASVYDCFDYVALGHIHKPQVITPTVRYSGSPLKYSFGNEESQEKGVVLVDTDTGEQTFLPIPALRGRVTATGTYEELLAREDLKDSYLRLHVTDRYAGLELIAQLRERFPFLLEVYGKGLTESDSISALSLDELHRMDEMDIMEKFMVESFHSQPSASQRELFRQVLQWSREEEET